MKYLIPGIVLVAFFWILAWTEFSTLSLYYFSPLWLGYILVLNGVSEILFKTSPIREMKWWFVFLFVISVPMWWFFEYLNIFVQNWYYLWPLGWSGSQIFVLKAFSFATVVPAVYSTGYLFVKFFDKHNILQVRPVRISTKFLAFLVALGVASFALSIMYPAIFFPLIWLAPLFIIDPLNFRLGFASVLGYLEQGRGSVVMAFGLGTLLTGFFWEMWNFYAFPKWVYTIPYFDFFKMFEMPILGYLGYLPFGLVVLTLTAFAFGLVGKSTRISL